MDQSISLNKFISDTGYCSRREADNLITSGRVLLNDRPAVLGNRYKPGDTVEVDGSLITAAKKEKRVYLALNKPPGITTTTELHIKDNIISFVNYPQRIFPIGRLDKDSEGLIFLTNDGDIINKILRAANNHEKEYVVRVNKPIDTAFLQQMSQGVPILDTRTLPCKVQMTGRQTFRITLTQGLNRQIRRMCEYLGYTVVGLQRVRIMNVRLDKLPLGKWRYLSDAEIAFIKESVADSSKVSGESKPSKARKKDAGPVEENEHPRTGFIPKSKSSGGRKQTASSTQRKEQQEPAFAPKNKPSGGRKHKSADRDNKPQTGKPAEKSWKKENPVQKSTGSHRGKPAGAANNTGRGKEKKDGRRGRR
ncbi:23S rRNA pseudouridine(2604) synthase RluF [Chitinophaga sp. YR627]|uniref:23S rRNA pseudouridine(2604) synthase RluF n=1 Tax=Chitinophaga sp. YR627 TaxID=1881041 RepID=UPI000B7DD481|nr:23S rRNA pseudouridine(2604) synthase RluF [Chitinophaga sp. YR627]